MTQRPPQTLSVDRIVILLMPGYPSLALATVINVLRLANRELGQGTFEWTLASPSGGQTIASDGASTAALRCGDVETADAVFVVAAYHPLAAVTRPLKSWLRRQHKRGCFVAGIESGSFVLAEAGILGSHAPALHHEDVAAFREKWPERETSNRLVNLDDRVATVAGVTATFDFALAFVERRRGPRVADQVARILYYDSWTRRDERIHAEAVDTIASPILRRCKSLMLENIQQPLGLPALCARLGVDERRLRRLFNNAIGVSPIQYYKAIRLTEARFILINSDFPVTDVGLACGFSNAASFSRAFKAHFGFAPSERREPYMGLMPSPFWPETARSDAAKP